MVFCACPVSVCCICSTTRQTSCVSCSSARRPSGTWRRGRPPRRHSSSIPVNHGSRTTEVIVTDFLNCSCLGKVDGQTDYFECVCTSRHLCPNLVSAHRWLFVGPSESVIPLCSPLSTRGLKFLVSASFIGHGDQTNIPSPGHGTCCMSDHPLAFRMCRRELNFCPFTRG